MTVPKLALAALVVCVFGPGVAQADSISEVEGARAKERAGYHLSRQDRDQLRRHGSNDNGDWYGGYSDQSYARDGYGSSASIYVGPRYYDDE